MNIADQTTSPAPLNRIPDAVTSQALPSGVMTVKDVIDELSKHDPRLPVAFQSFHPGWDGVRDIRIVPVVIAEDENHGADFHNHRTNGGSHDGPAMLCVGLV